jgi:tetratricopeptide (TPR) repeat protein
MDVTSRLPAASRSVGIALLGLILLAPAEAPARRARGGTAEPAKRDPTEDAFKHYQFGTKFYEKGMLAQAEDEFRKALALQPTYAEAHYLLGLVYLEMNDVRGALAEAEAALSSNIFLTEAHNLMGLAHAKMGDYEAALVDFRRVLSDASFPTPEVAEFNIGKVAWERQQFPEAAAHLRRALELNPQFGRAWYLLGDCQESLDQLAEARKSYEKAVGLMGSDTGGPRYRLGYVCYQMKDLACARTHFEWLRTNDPTGEYAGAAQEHLRKMSFR